MDSKAAFKKCVWYALDGISQVLEKFGARDPGSEGENRAQDYVTKELAGYCDEVTVEEFKVAPKAFMGFVPVTGGLMLAALGAYWVAPLWAAKLSLAGGAVAGIQFLKYKRLLDPLFPKRNSKNVMGVRYPFKGTRRRIILSGHMDAAYEWRYSYHGGPLLMRVAVGGAICSAAFKIITDVVSLVGRGKQPNWPAGGWKKLGLYQLLTLPFMVGTFFFTDFKRVVPGANDNLSGTFVAMAAMKYLKEMETRFPHTEVCCLITGSEEAGLRGAKAYAERHQQELMQTETLFLALETFRDLEHMAVYDRDMSGMVQNHRGASNLVQRAGTECDLKLPFSSIYVGASDAAAFSEAGIPATALAAMDPTPPRYYHTRLDNGDNLSRECIEKGLQVTLKAVEKFDEEGVGS